MTEPTDAELDSVLCHHWPAFSMQATLVRMWVRAAMRAAIIKWGTPSAEQQAAHKDDGFYEAVNDMDGLYQAAPNTAPSQEGDETDWYHGMTEKHFDRAVQKAIHRDRASRVAVPKAATEMECPSREKLRDMRHYLVEAHGFAAMSPRGKENIALALEILDELETLVPFHSAPKAAPGEPVVAAVFDEQLGRPMLVKGAPLLSHGQPLYTAPQQEPSAEE